MLTREEIIRTYDLLASAYASRFCEELDNKPFDRSLLQRFATAVTGGLVCDIGCGPGHITAHLRSLGLDVFGADLSPGMIAEARRRYPAINFQVRDMLDLEVEAGALSGIVAFYSIIHLRRDMLHDAFREAHRALRPGGLLLVSFHRGQGGLHADGVLGTRLSFDCTLFEPGEIELAMRQTGLAVVETTVRRPYANEHPTPRVYILADKP